VRCPDVRERIDIYKQFLPDGVETPIVLKYDVSMMPIMVLAISGDRKSEVLRDYARMI
jgi:multidrug efflux pump subunit AcrB